MSPTLERAWYEGVEPLLDGKITEIQAADKVVIPFRGFMLSQVRDKDLKLFSEFGRPDVKKDNSDLVPINVIVPAFMISELRRGFEIGLLIILPFLIIDLIVATLIMSMGMMMMPPSIISLPIKILFFILIDGWNLLVGSLMRSIS